MKKKTIIVKKNIYYFLDMMQKNILFAHTFIFMHRNDGIIISISVWQVIVEAIFNITFLSKERNTVENTLNNGHVPKLIVVPF